MKILFVTRGFPSDKDPMSGNYEAVQAKAIAAKGHQVSVIAIRWKSIRRLFSWSKISHRVVDGVDIYESTRICISRRFNFLYGLDRFLRAREYKRIFKRYLKEKGLPDIVHAHIVFVADSVLFVKKDYHLPFIITEHWSQTFKTDVTDWVKTQSLIYHHANRVISVSQALADSLKESFQTESIVINNMVSDLFFNSTLVERHDNVFKFVAVGAFRSDRLKGFDVLVNAFAQAHFPENISLEIIGDGPDRSFIENKIEQHSLKNQVKLLGVKTPEEVSALLCNSNCFVLSSRLETFSIVLIEAMAKGLPVIATKCGGPETFVRPQDGILVEKENVEELSKGMRYMTKHSQEYDAKEIRRHCRENFSQHVIADKIINVYKQVLTQN